MEKNTSKFNENFMKNYEEDSKFNDYKNCLSKNEIILKLQQRFKIEAHWVYTEQINKIALNSMMIKDYKILTELKDIHIEQMLLKYVKVRC